MPRKGTGLFKNQRKGLRTGSTFGENPFEDTLKRIYLIF